MSEARDNRQATREIANGFKVMILVVAWLAVIVGVGQLLGTLDAPGWLLVVAGVLITNVMVPIGIWWVDR